MQDYSENFSEETPAEAQTRINFSQRFHIIDMKKIKANPLNKTREERESCFPECGREELRQRGERV